MRHLTEETAVTRGRTCKMRKMLFENEMEWEREI
jgi:hypothetical protein